MKLNPLLSGCLFLAFTLAAAGQEVNEPDFICFDGFNEKISLNWQTIRPDLERLSPKKKPGCLTITAQQGTIHRDLPATAKNLFVLDNPLVAKTDFVMTTRLIGFEPTEAFQQAGLIVYDDDDNYLKWILQFNWREGRGVALSFLRETEAESNITPVPAPEKTNDLWLRLTKRSDRYEYSSSGDGKTFKVQGEASWGDGAPKRLGLVAKTGGANAAAHDLDAHFDFFDLRSPVTESKTK